MDAAEESHNLIDPGLMFRQTNKHRSLNNAVGRLLLLQHHHGNHPPLGTPFILHCMVVLLRIQGVQKIWIRFTFVSLQLLTIIFSKKNWIPLYTDFAHCV